MILTTLEAHLANVAYFLSAFVTMHSRTYIHTYFLVRRLIVCQLSCLLKVVNIRFEGIFLQIITVHLFLLMVGIGTLTILTPILSIAYRVFRVSICLL